MLATSLGVEVGSAETDAVGSPMEPEVHHACTFLFVAEVVLNRVCSHGVLANYIFT